jgi:hypothetical protein
MLLLLRVVLLQLLVRWGAGEESVARADREADAVGARAALGGAAARGETTARPILERGFVRRVRKTFLASRISAQIRRSG